MAYSCREESDYLNNSDTNNDNSQFTKDNVKTRILNKSDYESLKFIKNTVNQVQNSLKNKNYTFNTTSQSKNSETAFGYEIYTDVSEEVSYLDAKYTSFYILGTEDGFEEKLVLKSIGPTIVEKYIIRYKRINGFAIDKTTYQTLKITENSNSGNGLNLMMYIDSFSMGCSTYTILTYNCGHTGNHTNGQYCDIDDAYIPFDVVNVSFDSSCMSGGGGSGGPSSGSGGSGSTASPSTPNILTMPTRAPIYTTLRPKGKTCNPLGLNDVEITQLNSNYDLRLKIYQYLWSQGRYPFSSGGCVGIDLMDESNLFKSILKFFADNPTTAWDEFQPMLIFAQNFLEENPDTENPEQIFARIKALDNALAQNPNLLLDIPCNQLPYWQDVATHQVPQSVKTKIQNIKNQTSWWSKWDITTIDDGVGARLNMDLFHVKITSLPNKPGTTTKYTPAEFFDYFRKNINLYAETFTPIVDSYYGINDTALWNSSNPLGSLIHITIPGDNGTVVCSGVSTNAWVFSTIEAPKGWWHDGIHPVAGNRVFSYNIDSNGIMTIYTRGVDRISTNVVDPGSNINNIVNYTAESTALYLADQLWEGMQEKLSKHINDNGGSASKISIDPYRPAYSKIRNYIKGNAPITSLGCN